MRKPVLLVAFLLSLAPCLSSYAVEPDQAGFVSLFNGKDLQGWINVNCAPGTFYVKDSEIITTGQPTGFLRTAKQYENFEFEMEWMHVNKTAVANSGLFVWGDPIPAVGTPYTRGIEVQVLINFPKTDWATNHGDVFAIHGATCKPDRPHPRGAMRCLPSEERVKGAGEWNHYKVVAKDGVIKLHVNGKEVSGVSECKPRKGYLALESEGAECHFRNIKIKELPGSNPAADQVCPEAAGHKSLFDGLTLTGWKASDGSWKAGGGHLRCSGKGDLSPAEKLYAGELLFDWKLPAKATKNEIEIEVGGTTQTLRAADGAKAGGWTRSKIQVPATASSNAIRIHGVEGLDLMNIFFAAK